MTDVNTLTRLPLLLANCREAEKTGRKVLVRWVLYGAQGALGLQCVIIAMLLPSFLYLYSQLFSMLVTQNMMSKAQLFPRRPCLYWQDEVLKSTTVTAR
jgi:hypothetical protein